MRDRLDAPGEHYLLKTIAPSPDSCWLWMGTITKDGYPVFAFKRHIYPAHRWAYETFTGDILGTRHAHHTCRNPRCVNPNHIEPKTPSEHTDMHGGKANREKTHCKRGHEFTEENTYRWRRQRWCRTCTKAYKKGWRR